jgi:7-cyano-7-deazaguanine synthase in queuosine biosynthesis
MTRRFGVVINECVSITHSNPRSVNFAKTANNDPNLRLSVDNIVAHLPRELASTELDWIELIGSMYAADLACDRGEGDTEWGRDIELHVPLREPTAFSAVVVPLQEVFADLTSDRLRLFLHPAVDAAPTPRYAQPWEPDQYDCVALLSGGVDSYTGAVKLLDAGHKPILLSHGAGAQTTPQKAVRDALKTQFGFDPPFARLTAETVQNRFPGPEDSQRARTMLFIAAAALVATLVEVEDVYLNENGVMAVHVPLTAARLGSLSTKTAYPPIVEQMASIATRALGRRVRIHNNLIGLTKPEVAQAAVAMGAGQHLAATASCWSWHRGREHCGVCLPCLTRRISFEIANVSEAPHAADPFSNAGDAERPFARDNLVHLAMVVQEIQRLSDLELEMQHPEILDGGTQIEPVQIRGMYRRWAQQAIGVLSRYPVPKALMGL